MTTGIIASHCFHNMVSEVEKQVFENIVNLIQDYKGPVLGSLNERQEIKKLIPAGCNLDDDLNYLNYTNPDRQKAPVIIYNWIQKHNIGQIYIVGCHYNLCIRGVYNAVELARAKLTTPLEAHIIKECTAVLQDDQIITVAEYEKKGNQVYNVIKLRDVTR